MEEPRVYDSIEEIISVQTERVEELRQMMALVGDREYLIDELKTVKGLVDSISANIELLKQERDVSDQILRQRRQCQERAERLEERIARIDENLPPHFNRIELEEPSALECTMDNSYANEGLPIKRHLDFGQSMCESAQKPRKLQQTVQTHMPYLSISEFEAIPKYMRGRIGIEAINSFIDKINLCLADKYELMRSSKASLAKRRDVDRFNEYKRQECAATKGLRFFTQDTLKDYVGGKVDKQSLNVLTMLRHTRRVREHREGGLLRYINNVNNNNQY